MLAPLGVWLLLPFIAGRLIPQMRTAQWALGLVLIVAAGVLAFSLARDRHDLADTIADAGAIASSEAAPPTAGEDRTGYGGSGFSARYSALAR
ncbi:hypothetical protein [Bradyrhizobium sp. WSM2793]|uniref:hypothetical protein n=1 Tax=Bradyrhizobium sp. WSM2793 TaxID=1038866 RepID=UPI001FDABDF6|nr:hypothetical protein [Bradyrhizobium sp. WSM2793]